jgi:hypothetical protein
MKIDKSLEMKVKDLVSKLEYYHDEMEYEFEETLYELRELLSKNLPKEFKEIGYYDGYRQVLVAANIGYVKYLYVYSNYGSYTSSDVLSDLFNDFPEIIDDVVQMVNFEEEDVDDIIDSILSDTDISEDILQRLGEQGVIDYYDFETNTELQNSITDYLMEMVKGYLVDYNVIDEEVFDSMFESDEPLSEEEWVFLGYILLGDEFLKYGRLFEDTDVKPVVVNLGESE